MSENKVEELHKLEMEDYIKTAIYYLELASGVVESNDNFNDGQSNTLDIIYDKSRKAIDVLENEFTLSKEDDESE